MTKEEAIKIIDEKCIGGGAPTDIYEALKMAIEALKRDDPEVEFQKRLEHTTVCGYPFKELMVFADACRKYNVSESDMREFCVNAESAWNYIMDKMNEQMKKQVERMLS